MNEPQEERKCEKNCPDYNGMHLLHMEQCDCSCHQNRPGDGREEWVDGRTDLLGFNPAKFLRSSIRQLKRYLPENERFQKEVENIAIAAKTVHNETVSSEIKLALTAYRDAILDQQRGYKYGFRNPRYVTVEDIERVSGEFGL